jgi:hypothetical protein
MKAIIIKTILPTVFGILVVLGLLIIFNLVVYHGDALTKPDNGFFKYFVPIATIIAMMIQVTLTLPFWKKFKARGKIWGLTLVRFTGFLCIGSGLIFGFVFWERSYGINEWIMVTLTGIIAFTVYWAINLLTMKQLDKL